MTAGSAGFSLALLGRKLGWLGTDALRACSRIRLLFSKKIKESEQPTDESGECAKTPDQFHFTNGD